MLRKPWWRKGAFRFGKGFSDGGGTSVLVHDTFTEASETPLTSHIPDIDTLSIGGNGLNGTSPSGRADCTVSSKFHIIRDTKASLRYS